MRMREIIDIVTEAATPETIVWSDNAQAWIVRLTGKFAGEFLSRPLWKRYTGGFPCNGASWMTEDESQVYIFDHREDAERAEIAFMKATTGLNEGDVFSFKPKRRNRRHEIEILKIAGRSHPWAIFLHGQHLNSYKTEAEAEKVADAKEKEWDGFYDTGGGQYQIVPIGKSYALLDRGVRIGMYDDYTTAEQKAEELSPGSTQRMIDAWYR